MICIVFLTDRNVTNSGCLILRWLNIVVVEPPSALMVTLHVEQIAEFLSWVNKDDPLNYQFNQWPKTFCYLNLEQRTNRHSQPAVSILAYGIILARNTRLLNVDFILIKHSGSSGTTDFSTRATFALWFAYRRWIIIPNEAPLLAASFLALARFPSTLIWKYWAEFT